VRETCRVGQSSSGETVILVSCEDITEHKQAEEDLQRYEDQIRQMQKMQAIGQLAGGIAHDFNNILTAILGNAEIACSQVASDHPLRSNLMRILEAGNRASCLVQQILTFSHHQKFLRTVIALSSVVDEALAMLQATLPAGIELTNSCNPATPPILADATQILQVLINLCTNSWHALEGKPGHIAVDLAPITLTQSLHSPCTTLPPGHYACLSVRDTGCGMDPDTVTRIFDPFFTTKPAGRGTGLGLSVALGIVQGHDGGIVVNSRPGQGTTISLYFPAAEAPANTRLPVDTTPVQRQKRRCHLLYLDDEEMLVDLVRAKLEPLGYRIIGYTKPTEALAAVAADPDGFDIVVTDYNMPGMSGIEVARALTRLRADLPVVLVSGYLSPETQTAAFDVAIKEIVYKPSVLQQLDDVVARLIDTRPHPSTSTDRVI
jgi:signal transduction histidine kinase/ActR/RegA family two-component response regulator